LNLIFKHVISTISRYGSWYSLLLIQNTISEIDEFIALLYYLQFKLYYSILKTIVTFTMVLVFNMNIDIKVFYHIPRKPLTLHFDIIVIDIIDYFWHQ